jgi:hypothetical protein
MKFADGSSTSGAERYGRRRRSIGDTSVCQPIDLSLVLRRLVRQVWSWRVGYRCVEGGSSWSLAICFVGPVGADAPTLHRLQGWLDEVRSRQYLRIRRSERGEATLC